MDFDFNEEQAAFRTMAADFAANELAPHAEAWDATETFPAEALRHAAGLGLAGIYVREESGGTGLSRLDAAILIEELAAACPSTASYLSIHNMVAWMIDRFGDPDQRARFLPPLLTMDSFGSYCLTEPGAGSDAASLRTRARIDGGEYVLDGEKTFISGGGIADIYIVMARTGEAGPAGISAFVLEKGIPGLSFGPPEKKMGWRNQPATPVLMDGCRVPAANRLGREGDGFRIAMKGLDGGRINIGASSLGGARGAMEAARQHMLDRRQFGKRLADFQALQFKLADMATELDAARLMIHRAALALDRERPDATKLASMAKRYATDIGYQVCDEALQLHGGYGYIRDYGIERRLRDLRVHRILEGTNEIMRLIIARDVLKQ
ncbi:MAG: acyl-CoA dehydrogenase [Alphaproteobacteria bacterium]|jgi:alkylation response protein AidB-like acyl-CoA dehydrogenase|nr:acyl-CoA dehydrogenase [Alphaproteobacteria bacterium]